MTSTLTPLPAPAWLRQLTDARATYEELLGWPVTIQVGRRDLSVIVGGTIGAIAMPARLGASVRQDLTSTSLSGPIVADPTAQWWTFLTKPLGLLRPDVAQDLSSVRVRMAPRGACVEIPHTLDASPAGAWRWVERPVPTRP